MVQVSKDKPETSATLTPKVGVGVVLNSVVRLVLGLTALGVLMTTMILVLIPFLPWRITRIRITNHFGTAIGKTIMAIAGCRMEISGREHIGPDRPAIYIGNHTSIFDAFTSIWLSPEGTVGVAKKEVIWYPFYGIAWFLSGHLLIDRGNSDKAKASMRALADFVRTNKLHIMMWPEGTRAADGRLLPFKKGIVHLAIQTGLPIVPMITMGAHRAWEKSSLALRSVPIQIKFLPPISTEGWSEERLSEHVELLHQTIADALPPSQKPRT